MDLVFNDDRSQTYTATYKPVLEGPHRVHVNFSGVPTPKSPYHVNVDAPAGDPAKVKVTGPGVQPEGVLVNRPTYFEIHAKGPKKKPFSAVGNKENSGGLSLLSRPRSLHVSRTVLLKIYYARNSNEFILSSPKKKKNHMYVSLIPSEVHIKYPIERLK